MTWNNATADGKWSTAGNWTPSGPPLPGDLVVFDATSVSNCTADIVSNNLGGIAFSAAYTGTVTFVSNAVQKGMSLAVTGDISIAAGNLVFNGDTTALNGGTAGNPFGIGYALFAQNISISAGAAIHANGKGFAVNKGPGSANSGAYASGHGGGYGGQGGESLGYLNGWPYGSADGPTALGSGGTGSSGGGAIKLVVTNTITIDGTLSANGAAAVNIFSAGSGGSLWIASGTLAGSGLIAANGGTYGGGGGRIDLAGTTNNFSGRLEVLGGVAWSGGFRGMTGSIVFPQSAGNGLTLNSFIPATNIYLGNNLTFGNVVVTNGITLGLDANSNNYTYTIDTLTVSNGGVVLCMGNWEDANTNSGGTTAIPHGRGITLNARSVNIAMDGTIHANSRGFPSQKGPGGYAYASMHGGGYGGQGGQSLGFLSGSLYGSAYGPTALGSGGCGPVGGGAIKLAVTNAITIDGTLSANGGNGVNIDFGGSGGSIWIVSGTLVGSGLIAANGGTYAGGGGRIDISGATNNFAGRLEVLGGATYTGWRGLTGSIVFPPSAGNGLTLNSFIPTTNIYLGNSQAFSYVLVTNGITLGLDANSNNYTYTIDTLTVTTGGVVLCLGNREDANTDSGGSNANPHGRGVTINARTVNVATGGMISANGKGFYMQAGPGRAAVIQGYGGGHGGLGGRSDGVTGGLTYGLSNAPSALGSGGALTDFGRYGGGAIRLLATNTVTVDGSITANGEAGVSIGGGGSGGSVWLEANTLAGGGSILAKGGAGGGNGGGGGGGRILLKYQTKNFTGTNSVAGGVSGTPAYNGTNGIIVEVVVVIVNKGTMFILQ